MGQLALVSLHRITVLLLGVGVIIGGIVVEMDDEFVFTMDTPVGRN